MQLPPGPRGADHHTHRPGRGRPRAQSMTHRQRERGRQRESPKENQDRGSEGRYSKRDTPRGPLLSLPLTRHHGGHPAGGRALRPFHARGLVPSPNNSTRLKINILILELQQQAPEVEGGPKHGTRDGVEMHAPPPPTPRPAVCTPLGGRRPNAHTQDEQPQRTTRRGDTQRETCTGGGWGPGDPPTGRRASSGSSVGTANPEGAASQSPGSEGSFDYESRRGCPTPSSPVHSPGAWPAQDPQGQALEGEANVPTP